MKNSQRQQDYEWALLETLMIFMQLTKWVFIVLCFWYVAWLYNQ